MGNFEFVELLFATFADLKRKEEERKCQKKLIIVKGEEIIKILDKHSEQFITDMTHFCTDIINYLNFTILNSELICAAIKTNKSNQKTIS